MARTVIVDSGFLIALLSQNDQYREWAVAHAGGFSQAWVTCEAVLSEAFHLCGRQGEPQLVEMLRRRVVVVRFSLDNDMDTVLALMDKYADVPMSLADACLVRMTETLPDPVLLTTDTDFRIYRRHSRQTIPCRMP